MSEPHGLCSTASSDRNVRPTRAVLNACRTGMSDPRQAGSARAGTPVPPPENSPLGNSLPLEELPQSKSLDRNVRATWTCSTASSDRNVRPTRAVLNACRTRMSDPRQAGSARAGRLCPHQTGISDTRRYGAPHFVVSMSQMSPL